jgi:hypothetical protein
METSSTEVPTVPTLVARLGHKVSDDTSFDDDPNLLNLGIGPSIGVLAHLLDELPVVEVLARSSFRAPSYQPCLLCT